MYSTPLRHLKNKSRGRISRSEGIQHQKLFFGIYHADPGGEETVCASLLGGLISPRNQDKCAGRIQAEREPAAMHHMGRTAAGSSALYTDFCEHLHILQPTEGPEEALFCMVKASNVFSLHVKGDLVFDLKSGTFSD